MAYYCEHFVSLVKGFLNCMFTPSQCLFAILLNCESKFCRLVQVVLWGGKNYHLYTVQK